jgi:hypothetical protein
VKPASPTSANTIDVTWRDNTNLETSFEVLVNEYWGPYSVPANTTRFTWGGLPPGSCWWFKIRARNSVGISNWSEQAWACTFSY